MKHTQTLCCANTSVLVLGGKERQKLAGEKVGLVFGARTGERDGV